MVFPEHIVAQKQIIKVIMKQYLNYLNILKNIYNECLKICLNRFCGLRVCFLSSLTVTFIHLANVEPLDKAAGKGKLKR